jgi:hypothetical protein
MTGSFRESSGVGDQFASAWDWVKKTASSAGDWLAGIPGRLKSAFASVGSFITAPFRAAFNYVSDAWNNTIGRLSWSVPGWVPGIGGNSIGAPKLPHFHTGGIVSGALGSETLAVLRSGEKVTGGRNQDHSEITVVVELVGDGVLKVVRTEVGKRGGNVQRALGSSRG